MVLCSKELKIKIFTLVITWGGTPESLLLAEGWLAARMRAEATIQGVASARLLDKFFRSLALRACNF